MIKKRFFATFESATAEEATEIPLLAFDRKRDRDNWVNGTLKAYHAELGGEYDLDLFTWANNKRIALTHGEAVKKMCGNVYFEDNETTFDPIYLNKARWYYPCT